MPQKEEEEEECRIGDLGRVQDPLHLPNLNPLSASTTLSLALPLLLLLPHLPHPGTSTFFPFSIQIYRTSSLVIWSCEEKMNHRVPM